MKQAADCKDEALSVGSQSVQMEISDQYSGTFSEGKEPSPGSRTEMDISKQQDYNDDLK